MSSQDLQNLRGPDAYELHHALLRPVILQIMRAQGYHSSTPATVDAFTSLVARYMMTVSRRVAKVASARDENGVSCVPDITDVRMALEDCGAFKPNKEFTEQVYYGKEDTRGVDNFIQWAMGPKNMRIRKVAGLDKPTAGEAEIEGAEEFRETDYLSSLKRKHNRTGDDSKYASTILGRGVVEPELRENPVREWAERMHKRANRPPQPEAPEDSPRPPSSGLSSLADEDVDRMQMDMGF
ncbi:hypothetical protein F5B19DRAFT_491416 [Rostrohypoxylon terebratum]|nr:hypothetical protein F5B19DRAFT_491416 [Rostrohypoxylon terebratum]